MEVALTVNGRFSVRDDDGGFIEGGCEPGVCGLSDVDEGLLLYVGEDVGCACSFGEVMERQEAGVGRVHAVAVGLSYDDGSGSGADIFTWDVCT